MNKLRLLFWIGIVVLFLPLISLPANAKIILTASLGALVIIFVYKLKRDYKTMRFKLRQQQSQTEQITISTDGTTT